jgi:hypothetical protein
LTETGIEATPAGQTADKDGASRDAPRQHAIIEQATGWLAGRLDCSIREAAEHLAKLADDTKTTVAEAAALLVGDGNSPVVPRQAAARSAPLPTAPSHSSAAAGLPVVPIIPALLVDLVLVPAVLLGPVTDDNGEIVDFVIERHNGNATNALREYGGGIVTGARMLQLFPFVLESGMFGTLGETFRSGTPLRLDSFPYHQTVDGKRETWTVDVRGQRIGDWLLVTWSGHDATRTKIERKRLEAMLRLQQAILPTPQQEFRLGRYEIAVRYQPAHSRVGGDWYEVRPGSDGDVIVAIGDVAGHGLVAAAGMARIGNALRGLTVTGQPADTLLSWLNELVCADENPERVASAAVGSLSQERPRLRWAQAGHPPPVLVRDGEPRLLARPAGLLLGTVRDAEYELETAELALGDRLVFYTDGLIERRDRDIDEGLIALLSAASCCADQTAQESAAELAARLDSGTEDDVCLLVIRVLA